MQTIGNGCAFLDYDADGNLDILLVGSDGPRLYGGNGKGRFTETTQTTGMQAQKSPEGVWSGCAVGDIDNDGFPDVYLSGYRAAALLRNRRGRFEDMTRAAGIHPESWGTSCAFADFDGDGRLDLFVANYVRFGPNDLQLCRGGAESLPTSCSPTAYYPAQPTLYRNVGGFRFSERPAAECGVKTERQKSLGVAIADYDGDNRPDIFIANDTTPGNLLHNQGKMIFTDDAPAAGVAVRAGGKPFSGMGADWGDYDNDGQLDLAVASFEGEAKPLYHNDGDGLFTDISDTAGLSESAAPYVAFGLKFADFDNDGWLDILLTNGHIADNIERIRPGSAYRNPIQIFHNVAQKSGGSLGRRFEDVSEGVADEAALKPILRRGLAVGDYDNDGRIDVLIVDSEGTPLLLHNESQGGDWIGFRLTGGNGMNRDAYGAAVIVETGGKKRLRFCHADGSYLSSSDPRVLIGLGAEAGPVTVTIRWPDGKKDRWTNLPTGRYLTLTPGKRPR